MTDKREAYIIYDSILPEAIKKTVLAKEYLAKGVAKNINEAVKMADISRSVFYKYKDGIVPFYQQAKERVVTINVRMENTAGRLMTILDVLAAHHCNIHTLNQDVPLSGIASATITMEITENLLSLGSLLEEIHNLDGILKAEYIGELEKK